MPFLRRWLLISMVLALGCEFSFAAAGTKEELAYASAVGAFQDGMWRRAETEFIQFVAKYPASTNVTEAVLLAAQAEVKQGKYTEAIARLKDGQAAAGDRADDYVFWTGTAQLQGRDFTNAAATFLSLAQTFPNSRLRLRAVVEAATAYSELRQWPQMIGWLEATNGVFQQALRRDTGSELVARGELLLAQAKFAQNDFTGTAAVLQSMPTQTLSPELDWQRLYLLCQARLAAGEMEAALTVTTNLLQAGRLVKDDDLRIAESVAMRAGVLEKMGRTDDALAAYRENLVANAPVGQQRQAALKIAALAIGQNQFSNAIPVLEKFLVEFSNSPAADTVLLTLGELQLKESVAQPAATNELLLAQARFDQFIGTFTNSPLLGKAYLDRGWCFWITQNIPESLADFEAAASRLPFSEDLAVARFKAGDACLKLGDFSGARTNYQSVLDDFSSLPAVGRALGEQALYQNLRANLALNDGPAATATLARILTNYPEGDLSDNAILLVAESVANSQRPLVARALLQQFEKQFPHSELLPQARLAVARTYGQNQNWAAAVTNYEAWLDNYPTNDLRAQASYSLAQADYQAGRETNAFQLFTNFVAQYPTNDLAPLAQWWVADYFFRQSDYVDAERNYKFVFENWPASPLAYPARMMAGRAAVARLGYASAIRDYFIKLEQDTNCPLDLRVQATFAHGAALMLSESTVTNQPLANFELATNLFAQVCQLYPTNELGFLAWIEIGKCALQLSAFDAATNAYAQVVNSPFASVSARSQAQIGIGLALEKMAAQAPDEEQPELLQQALDNYLAVFFDTRFEANDLFWVKKAGLQALPLAGQLRAADLDKFIDDLERLFPQLKDSLEKKRATLRMEKT